MSVGCSISAETADNDGGPMLPSADAGIAFEGEGTLALAPGQEVDVTIVTAPPGRYAVTFALLGEALDASLSQTSAIAGDDGRLTVTLRAPTRATAFQLRASIRDGASASVNVAVSDQGFGRLVIEPRYDGSRTVNQWVGGALAGTTCEALAESLPNDPEGALGFDGPPDGSLEVPTAPVGPNLAVYVRAGHYMWGCTDTDDLEANGTEDIVVEIVDKPIDPSKAALDVDLAFEPDPTGWDAMMQATKADMMAALGTAQNGHPLLLAEMEGASADPQGFSGAATANAWETALYNHFQSNAVDLPGTFASYFDAGLQAAPPTILARIDAVEDAPGFARLTLDSIGNATPSDLNVPEEYTISLDVTPKDVAKFGGSVFFSPSRYVARAVDDEAKLQVSGASGMADVLASAAACDSLTLTGYPTCEGACLTQLCESAVAALWGRARAATDGYGIGDIVMQASGAADFDDYAALTGLSGTWIGQVTNGSQEKVSVDGAVVATPASSGPN